LGVGCHSEPFAVILSPLAVILSASEESAVSLAKPALRRTKGGDQGVVAEKPTVNQTTIDSSYPLSLSF
jgi:hypothetical protein